MNSEGWMLTPSRTSQRFAPLISGPATSVAITSARLMKKTIIASRRIARGESMEVPSMTTVAGTRKSACLCTKWNGSMPRRIATGGDAAKSSTIPISIKVRIAPTRSRSTVHHHSLRGVRWAREIMRFSLSLGSQE